MDGIYVARPLALSFLLSGLPFLISLFQKKIKLFLALFLVPSVGWMAAPLEGLDDFAG